MAADTLELHKGCKSFIVLSSPKLSLGGFLVLFLALWSLLGVIFAVACRVRDSGPYSLAPTWFLSQLAALMFHLVETTLRYTV